MSKRRFGTSRPLTVLPALGAGLGPNLGAAHPLVGSGSAWVLVIAIVVLVLGAAVIVIWRLRVGALVKRTAQLEDRVRQRTEALQMATEELHFLAFHDELTALINQRGFWQHADKLEMEARQGGAMFGLMLADLDHFKWINDRHGHRIGDEVLRHAAGLMQRLCRETDYVCRYGGEEFALLVPATDPDALRELAERLRAELQAQPFDGLDGPIAFTISIGISYWLGGKDNVEAMFRRADRAMYEAKETRNAWMMWNPAMDYDPESHQVDKKT